MIAGYLFALFLAVALTWWFKYVSGETREMTWNLSVLFFVVMIASGAIYNSYRCGCFMF